MDLKTRILRDQQIYIHTTGQRPNHLIVSQDIYQEFKISKEMYGIDFIMAQDTPDQRYDIFHGMIVSVIQGKVTDFVKVT